MHTHIISRDGDRFSAALAEHLPPLLDRHVATTKEWFPSLLMPYHLAGNHAEVWLPEHAAVSLAPFVASAVFVNLLTEDNLPYYFWGLDLHLGGDEAWNTWKRLWTAEEGRHSIAVREWVHVTRALDPVALELARKAQVASGDVPLFNGAGMNALDSLVYAALQELLTRISHFNVAGHIPEPGGAAIFKRLAADENLHFLLYRDLVTAALQMFPDQVLDAMNRRFAGFDMPGTGIPGYRTHIRLMAEGGILTLDDVHRAMSNLVHTHWEVPALSGLSPAGELARQRLIDTLDAFAANASRQRELLARRAQPRQSRQSER